jgi:ferredoxin/flavodoxin
MSDNLTASGIFTSDKNSVQIVYFSGTGGTERVASRFEMTYGEKGIDVFMVPLDMQKDGYQEKPHINDSVGLLILIYAVYALGAPEPVEEWINGVAVSDGMPAVVISVSGGGEMWPNAACRVACIKLLEKKGFNVFYERMLVMPSNVLIQTKEQLAVRLLKILPAKVEHCIGEILAGVQRRKKPPLTKGILIALSKKEKKESSKFGKNFRTHDNCSGCGWCANNCPRKNIEIKGGRPVFGERCVICLRCFYGCPLKSVYLERNSWIALKEGFSLESLEKSMDNIVLVPLEEVKAGIAFGGLKKYLSDMSF